MGKLKKLTEKLFKPKDVKPLGNGLYASLEELMEQRRFVPYLKNYQFSNVVSARAGDVKSAFKGRGMEFEEIRSYAFGDDVRDIDWRVTARKQKPYTKLFAEEKDREIYVLLDLSASMVFGTKVELKSVAAAKIAALFGWLSLENKDRFGCLIYDGKETYVFKPQNSRAGMMAVLKKISEVSALVLKQSNEGRLAKPLQVLQAGLKSRAAVFVISDFYGFDEADKKALATLSKKAQVYCVNVYDVLEDNAPKAGEYMAAEGKERVVFETKSKGFRNTYHAYFAAKRQALRDICRKFACRYIPVRTDEGPFYKVLMHR